MHLLRESRHDPLVRRVRQVDVLVLVRVRPRARVLQVIIPAPQPSTSHVNNKIEGL